jgi:predicted Holliday junction resolvase-like endonuclease
VIILIVVVVIVSVLLLTTKKKATSQQAVESQKETIETAKTEPNAAEAEKAAKEKPVIVAGQIAPDFELPRLTIETDEEGKHFGKISTETVKLSSYRGKRCVFLILSSYT